MRNALAIMLVASATAHAEPKDVAEVFPADTLLYVEVNQPANVAKDLTGYLQGTVFETAAPDFKILRQPKGQVANFNTSESGLLTAILAPEMLKEAARFKGVAGGIVGFTKAGDPEWLFIVMPGDSPMPGNLLKAYIAARADIRKVATVEGVDLFQRNVLVFQDDPLLLPGAGDAQGMKPQPVGPIYVNHPGLIVIGSNKDHVSAAIRRSRISLKLPSLSTIASFKTLLDERAKPGILVFADARRLMEQLDRHEKAHRESDSSLWQALRNLLPASSITSLVARLEIKDNALHLQSRIMLDPRNTSPLAELLDGAELAPGDRCVGSYQSPFTFAVALPPGDQRVPRLLACLDAMVRSTGTLGPNASELLQEMEEKKLLTRAELAKVNRITIVQPPVAAWLKNQTPVPALMLHSDDTSTLDKLEAAVPTILEMLGGAKADAVTETVNGVRVRTLEAKASLLGQPIHFGRHGNTFAIGTDRKALADQLRATPNAEMESRFKELERPAMNCAWNWVDTVRGPVPAKKGDGSPRRGNGIGEFPQASPYSPYGPVQPGAIRMPREALDPFDGLPPLIIALSRRANELHLDIHQTDPKRLRAKGISHLFRWYVQASANGNSSSGYLPDGTSSTIDFLPLIPPPPLPPNP